MSLELHRSGQALSWEEYEALPADGRAEYVDGHLLVSPSPTRQHQRICRRLAALIEPSLPSGWDVEMAWAWRAGDDEYIPDVMVYPTTDEQVRFTGTPALCIEVLSRNRTDDTVIKATRYATAGVLNYWIVDPRDGCLDAFTLSDSVYRPVAHLDLHGTSAAGSRAELSVGPSAVEVDLTALLAP